MIRTIKITLLLLTFVFLIPFSASAENSTNTYLSDSDLLTQTTKASGADKIFSYLPDDAQTTLDGMDINSTSDIAEKLNADGFLKAIFSVASTVFASEGVSAFSLFGVVLLCAAANSIRLSSNRINSAEIIEIAGTVCICAAMVMPLTSLISDTANVITSSSTFMLMYIPVMAGLMISAGQAVTAGSYYSLMMGASQGVTQLSSRIIIPLLNVFTALSVVSSISSGLSLKGICNIISKTTKWVLCFGMSIFVSLLTMQGIIGTSADNAASRAVRFAVRSFVPVVGSALSEAYLSVQGCVKLLKSGVGIVAILGTGFIYLPALFKCIYWMFMLSLVSAAAEIFSLKTPCELISSCSKVLGTLVAILLCCMSVFIISTALILIVGGGTA